MIIADLKLTNFGAHRELHLKDLTNMVGIIGPSGRGKTTAFQAIEFLFRGVVEDADAMETFIHDFGSPQQAPFAMVEGWIHAHGQKGYLMRKVLAGNGKNSRKLQWNGEEFTAESKIAAKLEELFDIGRKALISQAFQKQGEMYEGLFTTPIAREDYMLKLLNMAHYSGVAEAVSKERNKLVADLPDMTPALDQATYTYGQAHQEAEAAEAALSHAYNYGPDIATLLERDQHQRSVATSREAFAQASSNLDAALQSRDNQLAALGVTSVDALKATIEQRRKEKEDARLTLSALQSQNGLVQQRDLVTQQLTTTREGLEGLQLRIAGLKPMVNPQEEVRIAEAIHNADRRAALEARVVGLRERIERGKAVLAALPERPVVEDCTVALAAAQETAALYKPSLDLWDSLQRAGIHGGDSCICPTCKQDASKVLPDTQVIADARAKYAEATATTIRLTQNKAQQEGSLRSWEQNHAAITQGLETLQPQLVEAEADFATTGAPGEDVATLRNKLGNLQNFATQLTTAEANLEAAGNSLKQLQERLGGFSPDLPAVIQDISAAQTLHTTAEEIFQKLSSQLGTLTTTVDHHSRMEAVFHAAREQTQTAENKLAAHVLPQMANDALKDALAKVAEIADPLQERPDPLKVALSDLTTRQSSWQNASGLLAKAKEAMADANSRMQSIQATIDRQAQRRLLAGRLDRVAKAFGRGGVGSRIVQERWSVLIALTQAYLRRSEAPYSIRVSPTDPVSIDFMIHKRASAGYRPMSKMSGGEKMRFAVQFALSAQQLIMPKLGFLALDEPSTHLDDEGTHQLAEVLGSLHARLQNADAQVWVVDHSPLLLPALTSKIELLPLENETDGLTAGDAPATISDVSAALHADVRPVG